MKRLIIFIMLVLSSMTMFANNETAVFVPNVAENKMVYASDNYIVIFGTEHHSMFLSSRNNNVPIMYDEQTNEDGYTLYNLNVNITIYTELYDVLIDKQFTFFTYDLSKNSYLFLGHPNYISLLINMLKSTNYYDVEIKVKDDVITLKSQYTM